MENASTRHERNSETSEAHSQTTWCDCGGRSPGANEVRYIGLMDISREENDHETVCRIERVVERDEHLHRR